MPLNRTTQTSQPRQSEMALTSGAWINSWFRPFWKQQISRELLDQTTAEAIAGRYPDMPQPAVAANSSASISRRDCIPSRPKAALLLGAQTKLRGDSNKSISISRNSYGGSIGLYCCWYSSCEMCFTGPSKPTGPIHSKLYKALLHAAQWPSNYFCFVSRSKAAL